VNAHREAGVDMAVPGSERTVLVVRGGKTAELERALRSFREQYPDERVVVMRADDKPTDMEPVAISREEIMDAVQTPPALVQHAPARGGGKTLSARRAAHVVALAAALFNGTIVSVGAGEPKHRPNWLKRCLISRRKGWG
jgi:hypothetical protein